MITILIADDENWVVESLKASLDWTKSGCKIIGQAHNGIEALEKIETLQPDLVFVDIQMPGINGLQLIKQVRQQNKLTEFIIFSGYAEFAYAQRALNYGAIGYLLKPVDESELQDMLEKAVKKIESRKIADAGNLFEIIYDSNLDDLTDQETSAVETIIRSFGFKASEYGWFLLVVAGDGAELSIPRENPSLLLYRGKRKKAYLVHGFQQRQLSEVLNSQPGLSDCCIGISRPVVQIRQFKKALDEAEQALFHSFITGKKGIYLAGCENGKNMPEFLSEIYAAVSKKDISRLDAAIEHIRIMSRQQAFKITHVLSIYNTVISLAYPIEDSDKAYFECADHLVSAFNNMDEMLDYLKTVIISDLEDTGSRSGTGETSTNETIMKVIAYIKQYYCHDISVQSLALKHHINPNYLSQLFKKETGEALTEYITRLRMQYACSLLQDHDLLIYEVSEKVGYNSYFYFARLFRRYTGKTPTQYRQSMHES